MLIPQPIVPVLQESLIVLLTRGKFIMKSARKRFLKALFQLNLVVFETLEYISRGA
jgi:hypothetical protein